MLRYFFVLQNITPPLNEYSELEKMLALRKMGFSYTVLADTFQVPKTTIRYLCRRLGLHEGTVQPKVIRTYSPPMRTTTPPASHKYSYVDEEVINPGKTYAEYLQEAKQRRNNTR